VPRSAIGEHSAARWARAAGGVQGAGVVLRRQAVIEVGGYPIDSSSFAEEYDLCARLWQGGWQVRHFEPMLAWREPETDGRDANAILRTLTANSLRFLVAVRPQSHYRVDSRRDDRGVPSRGSKRVGYRPATGRGWRSAWTPPAEPRRRRPLTDEQLAELFGPSGPPVGGKRRRPGCLPRHSHQTGRGSCSQRGGSMPVAPRLVAFAAEPSGMASGLANVFQSMRRKQTKSQGANRHGKIVLLAGSAVRCGSRASGSGEWEHLLTVATQRKSLMRPAARGARTRPLHTHRRYRFLFRRHSFPSGVLSTKGAVVPGYEEPRAEAHPMAAGFNRRLPVLSTAARVSCWPIRQAIEGQSMQARHDGIYTVAAPLQAALTSDDAACRLQDDYIRPVRKDLLGPP